MSSSQETGINLRQAAGFIETIGYPAAVEAADVCVKTANVQLIGLRKADAGLVTAMIVGDVSAVMAAVEAGTMAADRVGRVVSSHVIPRPAEGVMEVFSTPFPGKSKAAPDVVNSAAHAQSVDLQTASEQELSGYRTTTLRNMARQIPEFGMSKNQIKFAKKEELIRAIAAHYRQSR